MIAGSSSTAEGDLLERALTVSWLRGFLIRSHRKMYCNCKLGFAVAHVSKINFQCEMHIHQLEDRTLEQGGGAI